MSECKTSELGEMLEHGPRNAVQKALAGIYENAIKAGRPAIDIIDRNAFHAITVWSEQDLEAMLQMRGIEPTDENVAKFAMASKSSLEAMAVQAGNESLEATLSDLIDRGELHA